MREIIVCGREIGVVENGRLCEYQLEDETIAQSLILGKVERIVEPLKSAFVRIGQEKNGFLPLAEGSKTFSGQPLRAGDRVLVQVKKPARGEKGAYLTRDITLPGRYLMLMPLNRYIGVSAKIIDEDQKAALRKMGEQLTKGEKGIVMRNSAAEADEADIIAELEELKEAWEFIRKKAITAPAETVVYHAKTKLRRLLDDLTDRGIDRVISDHPLEETEAIIREGDTLADYRHQLEKATQRRVWLPSGANLVIDPCEAMTVIDVNTAKGNHILKANLEAAEEIAFQIRLRNIGGIIIADMIDMETDEERAQVMARMQEVLRNDRIKTVVHGFTRLGLLEMTRKKMDLPLDEILK